MAGVLERDAEMDVLRASVDRATAAEGTITVVEGPPGVGKTTLLTYATERARAASMTTFTAVGYELERSMPAAVARRLLAPALADAGRSGRARLLRGLPPQLARLLDGEALMVEAGGVDASASVVVALAALFERILDEGDPVAIIVDDAHWADPVSLRLLCHLARGYAPAPLALVLAARTNAQAPAELHSLRAADRARIVRLSPLSDAAVQELVRSKLPEAEPAFCDQCARATAGNPFLLRALLRSLQDDGITGTGTDRARLNEFVPEAVLSSALVRLARCSDAAVRLARAAAVLGEAPLRHAAAVADVEPRVAEHAADELAAAGFAQAGEPFALEHPMVARAIYRDLPEYARARAHRVAAEVLERDAMPSDMIAAHLLLSRPERDPAVVQVLQAAARRALGSGDPQAAIRLLERALAEPPEPRERAEILIELADARAASGTADAMAPLQQALELIDEPRRRAEALHDLGILLLARHDLPGAAACAQQAREEVPEGPVSDALEGILLASAVLVPELHHRVHDRIEELRTAALAGQDPQDPVTLAVMALHMVDRGDDPAVVSRLTHAAFVRSADRPAARAATINHLGSALVYSEDLTQAEHELTAAIEQAERTGRTVTSGFAHAWRAFARLRCGRLAGAREDCERALELRHLGWQMHLGPCLAALVEAAFEQGDEAGTDAALEIAKQSLDLPRQPLVLRARARVSLAAGDTHGAVWDITAAHEFLWATHELDNPVILPWRSDLAWVRAHEERTDEAVALALEEARLAAGFASARAEGIALGTAGTIARRTDLLEQAAEKLSRTPAELEHARVLLALGAIWRRTRQRAASREPLRRALEIATRLGARPLAERARDELRATGARPRRVALDGVESLTPTERRVAQLAADGLSNREIGDRLVVTPKTVEWHLSRVFAKLGISRRVELDPDLLRDT
jgi:DNA-binding CsgD family transcriptional regulator